MVTEQNTMLVLVSYHHKNTEKVADVIAKTLNAPVTSPQDVDMDALRTCRLVGFGSGIYDGMHHRALLQFAEKLPNMEGKKVFLFSTSAIMGEKKVSEDHSRLRKILQGKGCLVVDEFACKGFNTNSFLRYFGGMNKGRPNSSDLASARDFARRLEDKMVG